MISSSSLKIAQIDPSTARNFLNLVEGRVNRVLYSLHISLQAPTVALTITTYGVEGNVTQTPLVIADDCEIEIRNVDYSKIVFSDANSYTIYVSYVATRYSTEEEVAYAQSNARFQLHSASQKVNVAGTGYVDPRAIRQLTFADAISMATGQLPVALGAHGGLKVEIVSPLTVAGNVSMHDVGS